MTTLRKEPYKFLMEYKEHFDKVYEIKSNDKKYIINSKNYKTNYKNICNDIIDPSWGEFLSNNPKFKEIELNRFMDIHNFLMDYNKKYKQFDYIYFLSYITNKNEENYLSANKCLLCSAEDFTKGLILDYNKISKYIIYLVDYGFFGNYNKNNFLFKNVMEELSGYFKKSTKKYRYNSSKKYLNDIFK